MTDQSKDRKLATPNITTNGAPPAGSAKLSDLSQGQVGRIVALPAEPRLALQMIEMGMVCGRFLQVFCVSPMGGPIAINMNGTKLSLRRNEAEAVLVSVE